MVWWHWVLIILYLIGCGLTVVWHAGESPNATIGLVTLRTVLWPIFWATGWPQGVPLGMD